MVCKLASMPAVIPADVIVHPKLVLTRKSGELLLKEMERAKPTKALRDLLRDRD